MEHQHLCVSVVPLFNHLAEAEQQKIHELVSHRKFKKGEQIFSPADEAQLVIVAQGKLKVYQLSSSGKEQLLRVSLPGSYEGESQLFGVPNDSLFAEALEPTEICLLRQRDFSNLLLHYPELSLKLLEINAEKMAKIEQQTQFLMMEKVEERLATYLLDLFQVEENVQLNLPMKMKELAAFLGTTPETLSRKFKLLEKQQLIQRKGRVIELTDIEGLEEL
ncbi:MULTISPECIES: Crp/Fnr family transcriptional regulator [Enterococcus]|uniref:Crp/Fnr family transcriptional regulator n=1 Tax=Enterococcus thailandicus TaxID=417368 RepID=A0A179EUZ1_ENTTH|nr:MULTISPECIES: Crp/Fnr family transcriptional regulator [Enterococcus]ASZ06690.1 Crp/Fnr family transcriptional regulator [Enterococcus thailandicus]MDA3966060.1 Crp/Fnr family transcriptional regulator [Enterococcus thailandicus]MDK4352915.1 Crp/Fnr family transcriptional regulator [Enterococcus thailandicus]MDT2734043.1 Crp/Fnr family transcriptional regulator [Enterococcus thailandicus]MDT2751616.1 Crp/Fnr family transcriptional regulator [Enterococcus thailandicus]